MSGTVRTTIGGIGGSKFTSKKPGTPTGVGLNTFGLQALKGAVTGDNLVPILLAAIEPAKEEAFNEWPKRTWASSETIRTEVVEVGSTFARVALTVGGQQLIDDPRNESHKDYSPYIEYVSHPGILFNAMNMNNTLIKEKIREGVRQLIEEAVGGR